MNLVVNILTTVALLFAFSQQSYARVGNGVQIGQHDECTLDRSFGSIVCTYTQHAVDIDSFPDHMTDNGRIGLMTLTYLGMGYTAILENGNIVFTNDDIRRKCVLDESGGNVKCTTSYWAVDFYPFPNDKSDEENQTKMTEIILSAGFQLIRELEDGSILFARTADNAAAAGVTADQ